MQPDQYSDLNAFANCPSSYTPPLFFSRYLRAFLPPYFADTAERIGKQSNVDFTQLWGWESARLMACEGISEVVGDVGNYASGSYHNYLNGATSMIAEVYRSAFLRTVAWFRLSGLIDRNDYIEYSLKMCPVDPSIWEIESQSAPSWWPRVSSSSPDIETLPEWDQCEGLLGKEFGGGRLVAAEGAVIPSLDRPLTASEFTLLPMGYSVEGPETPEASQVFHALRGCVWLKFPQSERPLVIFDGKDMRGWIPLHDSKDSIADLTVRPLVGRVRSLNINQWHPWHGCHPPFFPSVNLATPNGRPCKDSTSWFYETEGQKVFWGHDWKIGSLERSSKGQYMLHGQYAIAERKWLELRLDDQGLRLGHILRISIQHRKNEYDEPQIFHSFKYIGMSNLIV